MFKLNRLRAILLTALVTVLCTSVFITVEFNQRVGTPSNLETFGVTIHSSITFTKNGKIICQYTGLDPLTHTGLSFTFAKLTGDNYFDLHAYNMNATYVVLGNATVASPISVTSTSMPNEFANVLGTVHAQAYNGYNLTGIFSGITGPYDSNCMGIEYNSTGLGGNDLFGYITFPQVTNIDASYVITCEIQIQGTTS